MKSNKVLTVFCTGAIITSMFCAHNVLANEALNSNASLTTPLLNTSDLLTNNFEVVLMIQTPYALKNGVRTAIDSADKTIVPYVEGNRTLVPLRFISEAFNAEVSWNPEKKEIKISYAGNNAFLTVESNNMYVNGKVVSLDSPPIIVGGRCFVPLRAISEDILGKKVAYNNGLIVISDNNAALDEQNGFILRSAIFGNFFPNTTVYPMFAVKQENDSFNFLVSEEQDTKLPTEYYPSSASEPSFSNGEGNVNKKGSEFSFREESSDKPTIEQPPTDSTPSLRDFLSGLICSGCSKRCPLIAPQCLIGEGQAYDAELRYNATYSQSSF